MPVDVSRISLTENRYGEGAMLQQGPIRDLKKGLQKTSIQE